MDLGNDEGVAIVELDAEFSDGVIGENGEQKFNTVVTTFIPDTERDGIEFDYAEHLLNNPNNDRVTIVEKATHEDLHRLDSKTDLDESLNDSISDSSSKIKHSTEDSDVREIHHSFYFSDEQIEKINDGDSVFFISNSDVETLWRDEAAPAWLVSKIRGQLKFNDIRYSQEDKEFRSNFGESNREVDLGVKLPKSSSDLLTAHIASLAMNNPHIMQDGKRGRTYDAFFCYMFKVKENGDILLEKVSSVQDMHYKEDVLDEVFGERDSNDIEGQGGNERRRDEHSSAIRLGGTLQEDLGVVERTLRGNGIGNSRGSGSDFDYTTLNKRNIDGIYGPYNKDGGFSRIGTTLQPIKSKIV